MLREAAYIPKYSDSIYLGQGETSVIFKAKIDDSAIQTILIDCLVFCLCKKRFPQKYAHCSYFHVDTDHVFFPLSYTLQLLPIFRTCYNDLHLFLFLSFLHLAISFYLSDLDTFVVLCVCVQSHLTLFDLIDHSLLGSSVHGIFQARILEWVAISFSNA